ncbi:hypothetical protein QQ045_025578 [Rhodiola kirilowii]
MVAVVPFSPCESLATLLRSFASGEGWQSPLGADVLRMWWWEARSRSRLCPGDEGLVERQEGSGGVGAVLDVWWVGDIEGGGSGWCGLSWGSGWLLLLRCVVVGVSVAVGNFSRGLMALGRYVAGLD